MTGEEKELKGFTVPGPDEIRDYLRAHALTGSAVANIVGVDPRTVRKWTAKKDAPNFRKMPYSAWKLLNIVVEHPELNSHS